MFALVFVIVIVNFIDRASLSIAMPLIAAEFELSPAMQGLILSSFFWTYALAQIPGGWLLDRIGSRRVIAASTGLWGVFQAVAGGAVGGISLLFTRLGLGAAEHPLPGRRPAQRRVALAARACPRWMTTSIAAGRSARPSAAW